MSKKENHIIDFTNYYRIKVVMIVAYNGALYDGLAIQESSHNTIEEHFIRACIKLRLIPNIFFDIENIPFTLGDFESQFHSQKNETQISITDIAKKWISFSRCGRTDKGVSAFRNAVSLYVRGSAKISASQFESNKQLQYDNLLNKILPPSIRILGWSPVADTFDARFSCIKRTYRYFFDSYGLNISKMIQAAQFLEGEHDFRNFCWMDVVSVTNFVRNVYSAKIFDVETEKIIEIQQQEISEQHRMCFLEITANAFLYHQIRCIMSVLIVIGAGFESPHLVTQLFDFQQYPRKPFYALANPLPLVLWECEFNNTDIQKLNIDSFAYDQILSELKNEANIARIRISICGCMHKSISSGKSDKTIISPIASELIMFEKSKIKQQEQLQITINNTTTSKIYLAFSKRNTEKMYDEKIACLSENKKQRMKIYHNIIAEKTSSTNYHTDTKKQT